MNKFLVVMFSMAIVGCSGTPPKPTPIDFDSGKINLINGQFPMVKGIKTIIPSKSNEVWKYSINSRLNANTDTIEFYYALGNANKIYIHTKHKEKFENSKQALINLGAAANVIWVSQPNFPENYTHIDFVRDVMNEK
ncbi:hypothetical protein [Xenorhabdus entomophaga]|uniref:hypothetical protein n=1 Tax=Xenorhabdus entomophaga TaxID=3136257 RepID=UPI0030F486CB